MIFYTIIGTIVWTVVSFIWFYMSLGRKNKPDRWFDYILAPPVLVIVTFVGYLLNRKPK